MRRFIALVMAGLLLLLGYMFIEAMSVPVIRRFDYHPAGWPPRAAPMRLVLVTDPHVSWPDMTPERLGRIVTSINALKPDLVLLGGDYLIGRKLAKPYSPADSIRPLAALKARNGVIAVMGNHDHWTNLAGARQSMRAAGVKLLDNDAVRIGPLVIGGVDDDYSGHADVARTAAKMDRLGGIPILLSHSPDIFPITPYRIKLVLAGHTHCGQIALPLFGPLVTSSHYGLRYACGLMRSGDQMLIVSAGIGTSQLPLRLAAQPDIWVIDIGAPQAKPAAQASAAP